MKRLHMIGIVVTGLMLIPTLAPLTPSSAFNQSQESISGVKLRAIRGMGTEVQVFKHGRTRCRDATPEEALVLMQRDPDLQVHEITPAGHNMLNDSKGGLRITLRATSQLESFSLAKEAFLKAAAVWESIIQTPISVVVDVDFGLTHFGKPFDPDTLGLTHYQVIGDDAYYPTVRSKLISGASSAEEDTLYSLLPTSSVPTDLGNTLGVYAPSAVFRALGMIGPIADPAREEEELGPPPTIGFNSAFEYDFDPSDGIDLDKFNFVSLAEHEIGHLLGFFSVTGLREVFPDDTPVALSVWDLCRFRPGINLESFGSSPRILSSGGEQVFFAGRAEVPLSTGRPDHTGGDLQQPSHWKDDLQTGLYIGVMDPTLDLGGPNPITHDDLDALDAMGYQVARDFESVPVILDLAASLDGDDLSLTGTAADPNGDIVQAQVKLLDGSGLEVAETFPFVVDLGTSPEVSFWIAISGLSDFPTGVQAMLTLIDRDGNTSTPFVAGFDQSDVGGPSLNSVILNGKKLKVKGKGLDGSIALEINGVIVATGINENAKRVIVKGSPFSLNLRSGPNRIRARKDGLWSNIYILDL